jgi:hypothetical protein
MKSITLKYLQDNSWQKEIDEFTKIIINNENVKSGSSLDALNTMKLVYSIYNADLEWKRKYNIEDIYEN